MPIITETPSNSTNSMRNTNPFPFVILHNPPILNAKRYENKQAQFKPSQLWSSSSPVSESQPSPSRLQPTCSFSFSGGIRRHHCLSRKGEESTTNRIALDKGDGKKAKASSNSAQVLSMPVAVVPRRRYGTGCIRWRIRCENVRSEE